MAYKAPLDDIQFLINDVFDLPTYWESLEGLEDFNAELVNAVLEEAAKLSEGVLDPIDREGDEEGCKLVDGQVITPKGFKEAYKEFAEGGWVGVTGNPEYGGQGMPKPLTIMISEIIYGASQSFQTYLALTAGACLCIDAHASEELKQTYLPPLYEGRWQGVMALTESHVGTDLGGIRTKAIPQADGSYEVTGNKIFITGGDTDMTENHIHLVLAKLPDAPAGPKGISLFLVPKFMVNEDGSLGERNGMSVGSIEHKMGIKASATCVMNYEGAKGYLVGEVNRGLNAMFTMMNYERLAIGIQGLGAGEHSYQQARDYALDRHQGRAPASTAPKGQTDAIVEHPDVRRMLMTQRALNEGGRAMAVYIGKIMDTASRAADPQVKAQAEARQALLTPVAKAFLTDMGLDITLLGQMVFGGHGYIREWGQEQLVRDVRIAQIYEGTNGIQSQDLVKRKLLPNGGEWMFSLIDEIDAFAASTSDKALAGSANTLRGLTEFLVEQHQGDPNLENASCVEYLHVVGYVLYHYMFGLQLDHLKDADSQLATNKRAVAAFYEQRILPRVNGLEQTIRAGSESVMGLATDQF